MEFIGLGLFIFDYINNNINLLNRIAMGEDKKKLSKMLAELCDDMTDEEYRKIVKSLTMSDQVEDISKNIKIQDDELRIAFDFDGVIMNTIEISYAELKARGLDDQKPEDQPAVRKFYAEINQELLMSENQIHFPRVNDMDAMDSAVESIDGLDTVYAGMGFTGLIAYNEAPRSPWYSISEKE